MGVLFLNLHNYVYEDPLKYPIQAPSPSHWPSDNVRYCLQAEKVERRVGTTFGSKIKINSCGSWTNWCDCEVLQNVFWHHTPQWEGTTPHNEKSSHARILHYMVCSLQNVCSVFPTRLKTFKAQPACPQIWFNAKICSHNHSKTCIQALHSHFLSLPASGLFLTAIARRHRWCKMMSS